MSALDESAPAPGALSELLDKLSGLSFPVDGWPVAAPASFTDLAVEELAGFLKAVETPFGEMATSGLFGNPWVAASLRRNEVRNAAVLRWFLDPKGGHGCGDKLLLALLSRITTLSGKKFSSMPSPSCRVTVEDYACGGSESRVDIMVDDRNFFLIIEVKVDAGEQQSQLERYVDIVKVRAGAHRSGAVVFLTLDGRSAVTAAGHGEKVNCLSWRDLSGDFRRMARQVRSVPAFLAQGFADHLDSL